MNDDRNVGAGWNHDALLVLRAVELAERAHRGQTRKYTVAPYLTHCLAVAKKVSSRTLDPCVIAAAVLHDTLEDTEVTHGKLVAWAGERVANLVLELTDHYTSDGYPGMNRAARKAAEAERLGHCSAEAQLIKAYDLLDNTSTIVEFDPGFARIYLPEKRAVVARLTKLPPYEQRLLREV